MSKSRCGKLKEIREADGWTCGEKYRERFSNQNMEDGSDWTPRDRKTETEVDSMVE